MIYLMNSAVMTSEGSYETKKIKKAQFVELVQKHRHEIISRIGYPQNLKLLEIWTGIRFSISRDQTKIEDGQEMLCMCLKYRIDGYKGKQVDENDFQFFHVKFKD